MSLLTDLRDLVTAFNEDQFAATDTAALALLNSYDFENAMRSAAQQGELFVLFQLNESVINGMYKDLVELKEIEDNLIDKLESLYPGIKFYKDKYKKLAIYGQWEEYPKYPVQGPVIG